MAPLYPFEIPYVILSAMSKIQTPQQPRPSLLLKISGPDAPGITSELTGILARNGVTVIDIAQAVIHGLLSLSILIEAPHPLRSEAQNEFVRSLFTRAHELGLKAELQAMEPATPAPARLKTQHFAMTLIAECISAQALHRVTSALARHKLNIDVIKRLSEHGFGCVELQLSAPDAENADDTGLRKELLLIAKEEAVDIALQREGLYRRAKRLVVLDMDSTLIQAEVIDELAREMGVYDDVAAITHEAMMGKMDFDESLRRRCSKLEGLDTASLENVFRRIQLTPGARELIHVLKKLGYKIALISGGFTFVAERFKNELGIDFVHANVLETRDGRLTGKVIPPIVNAQRKADLLELIARDEGIDPDQVIAIGDGANDLLMLEKAGLGIAFNAKPLVRERADTSLSQKNLRSILYLLGLSSREVSEVVDQI